MHSYQEMRIKNGVKVSQTLDRPITYMDTWEPPDICAALGTIIIFGVLFQSFILMIIGLIYTLGFVPWFKRTKEKGFFIHWPYQKLNLKLPGLFNPGINKTYSD